MGKKSNKTGSKKPVAKTASSAVADAVPVAEDVAEDTSKIQEALASTSDERQEDLKPTTSASEAPDLASENAELRRELEALRRELQSKDEELMKLKGLKSCEEKRGATADDLDALQVRLAELKQEQLSADTQRENAWKELRRVIEEVTSLAEGNKIAV